ncbi:hypothetical protein RA20_01010 [Leisingera sp. ANG-Vp]|nr:hypothetical protein RA20_01010 [Leisingera sp. ANG-Vp]
MKDNSNIGISINGVDHSVLCGICQAPVSIVGPSNCGSSTAGCVKCANIADLQEVLAMAIEFTREEEHLRLRQLAQGTGRRRKAMTVDGRTTHDQVFRFIVDLKV